MEFNQILDGYVITRTKERLNKKHEYNHYFLFIPLGDSYKLKMAALGKFRLAMNQKQDVKFSDKEIIALTDGRLGAITKKHMDQWPACFVAQYILLQAKLYDRPAQYINPHVYSL